MKTTFTWRILGAQAWDEQNDNVDIEVTLSNNERYTATFFTLHNIHSLFEKNRVTGECAGGLYLWASNMIIVTDLQRDTVCKTIASLLDDGEFDAIFCKTA